MRRSHLVLYSSWIPLLCPCFRIRQNDRPERILWEGCLWIRELPDIFWGPKSARKNKPFWFPLTSLFYSGSTHFRHHYPCPHLHRCLTIAIHFQQNALWRPRKAQTKRVFHNRVDCRPPNDNIQSFPEYTIATCQ